MPADTLTYEDLLETLMREGRSPTLEEAQRLLSRAWERFVETRGTPDNDGALVRLRTVRRIIERLEEREVRHG